MSSIGRQDPLDRSDDSDAEEAPARRREKLAHQRPASTTNTMSSALRCRMPMLILALLLLVAVMTGSAYVLNEIWAMQAVLADLRGQMVNVEEAPVSNVDATVALNHGLAEQAAPSIQPTAVVATLPPPAPATTSPTPASALSLSSTDGILILVDFGNDVDVASLHTLLAGLLVNCNWARNLPVIVMYDSHERYAERVAEAEAAVRLVRATASQQVRFVDLVPMNWWTAPKNVEMKTAYPKFGLGYRMMCDLWGTRIQDVARHYGLEYYMRLDADASMQCDPSDFGESPFETLRNRNAVYGYYSVMHEGEPWSKEFMNFATGYMRNNNLHVKGKIAGKVDLKTARFMKQPLMFYNNLEVVKVAYLYDPRVVAFTQALAKSGGVYKYRWGDAVIRFWQVALFSSEPDIVCLSDFKNRIQYMHKPFFKLHCELIPPKWMADFVAGKPV